MRWTLRLFAIVFAIVLGLAASRARAEWLLSHAGDARAGDMLEIDILLANDTGRVIPDGMPARLPGRVLFGLRSIDVTLDAIQDHSLPTLPPHSALAAPIAVGGFRKQRYQLLLPSDAVGPVTVALIRALNPRVVVLAEAPRAPLLATAPPMPAALANDDRTSTTIPIDRNVVAAEAALSTHEPMFFIAGTRESPSAKMQLSFKYRLLDAETWLGQRFWPLANLHFAYTQTSIWDIGKESSPFRDTSYRPSLLYHEPRLWRSVDQRQSLSLSGGLEHESNGKDGANSRSINIAFVRPRWRYALDDAYFIRFDSKLYGYLEKSDNGDIRKYRGYGDYAIGFGHSDEWLWTATFRLGTSGVGSTQIDASYRIRQRVFANASGFLYAQLFSGYGESLIDYNVQRRSQIRIGFGIVR